MFAASRLKKAVGLREKYFNRIQAAFDLIKEIEGDKTKTAVFLSRAERVDEDLKSFECAQDTIMTTNEEVDTADKIDDVASMAKACDELYFEIKAVANRIQPRTTPTRTVYESSMSLEPQPTQATPRSRIKLPRIDIPQFSGDLTEWSNFRTLFETLIHNNSELSPAEKFHYLRGSLKGPALRLIESIHISEANYNIAYNTLLLRYNNKRRLANLYIEKITNVKPLTEESVEGLQRLSEIFITDVTALQTLDLNDLGDLFLLHFGLRGLDHENRKRFEDKYAEQEVPTFENFAQFIEDRRNILELVAASKSARPTQKKAFKEVLCAQEDLEKASEEDSGCALCQEDHRLSECPTLMGKPQEERFEFLRQRVKGVCFNCLAVGHISRFCRSEARCKRCQRKHHSILHSSAFKSNSSSSANVKEASPARSTTKEDSQEILSTSAINSNALLGTAMALIMDRTGRVFPIRMVIDCGAQRSFITCRLAEKLRLKTIPNPHGLRGFGGAPIADGKRQARCVLLPRKGARIEICTEAVVIPKICSKLPHQRLPQEVVDSFKGLKLADEGFHEPGEVDFLLGADVFLQIFNGSSPQKDMEPPSVMDTIFGAVVMGPMSSKNDGGDVISLLASSMAKDLPQFLKEDNKTKEVPETPTMNPLDKSCKLRFPRRRTRKKDASNRIRRSIKEKPTDFGDMKSLTSLKFYPMEFKLLKNKELMKAVLQLFLHLFTWIAMFLPVQKVRNSSEYLRRRINFGSKHALSDSIAFRLYVKTLLSNLRKFMTRMVFRIKELDIVSRETSPARLASLRTWWNRLLRLRDDRNDLALPLVDSPDTGLHKGCEVERNPALARSLQYFVERIRNFVDPHPTSSSDSTTKPNASMNLHTPKPFADVLRIIRVGGSLDDEAPPHFVQDFPVVNRQEVDVTESPDSSRSQL